MFLIFLQAKGYIKRHEGQLQERLAQSKSTRDIYARFNILLNTVIFIIWLQSCGFGCTYVQWALEDW